MSPKIIRPADGTPGGTDVSLARPAGRAAFAAGLLYLVGSLTDLGILWLGQRQPGLQWEFVAITNTLEAWPRLVLSLGLIYLALHLGGSASAGISRLLAVAILGMGVVALVLGGLLGLNYLQVAGTLQDEGAAIVKSSVLKSELLCALYVLTLVPVGLMGLRRPEAAGRTS